MRKAILIVLHFALTLIAWTSWLWVAWDIIAVLSLAHIVMLESLDGCPLTHAQMGKDDSTFYEWWLGKLGIKNYDRKKLKIFMRYWVPLIITILAIIVNWVNSLTQVSEVII